MQSVRFSGVADDSKILTIGTLFRRSNEATWGINLTLQPAQSKTSLTLSHAPILVCKHVLNPTSVQKQAGYPLSVSIQDTAQWQHCVAADCPIQTLRQRKEKNQHCFSFQAEGGVQVYLPQFELARVLFFRNGYLARTALQPDSLKLEFDIQLQGHDKVQINLTPLSGFPHSSLNDHQIRQVLSWILLDPQARASFESIGRYQQLHGYEQGGYRRWDFQFDPPSLPGAELDLRGHFDKASNCLFVYEVVGLNNIAVTLPASKIYFHHPAFKEYVRGSGSAARPAGDDAPIEPCVHDDEQPSACTAAVGLPMPAVALGFSQHFDTSKLAAKTATSSVINEDKNLQQTVTHAVSLEESTLMGELLAADWSACTGMGADELQSVAQKFACFEQMLRLLVAQHPCQIVGRQLRKLPRLPRSSKHLLGDGRPRCISIVELMLHGRGFLLLEVDTSDAGSSSLSTLLLQLTSSTSADAQLKQIEIALVKQSLRWPGTLLECLCGKAGFAGIHHPKAKSMSSAESEHEALVHWAKRVYCAMDEM